MCASAAGATIERMGDSKLSCERCGESIDVHEQMWWQRPDGGLLDMAYVDVIADRRSSDPESRFYHHGCLGPRRVVDRNGKPVGR
jgi:hypothetical protein